MISKIWTVVKYNIVDVVFLNYYTNSNIFLTFLIFRVVWKVEKYMPKSMQVVAMMINWQTRVLIKWCGVCYFRFLILSYLVSFKITLIGMHFLVFRLLSSNNHIVFFLGFLFVLMIDHKCAPVLLPLFIGNYNIIVS